MENQKKALANLLEEKIDYTGQITCLRQLLLNDLSVDVITYAVNLFREKMTPLDLNGAPAIDLCGTGGDKSGTFNISTTAAFVVTGAGVPVAKHGNVSITSKSGSIDLLKALNISIPSDADAARKQFDRHGLCFLFAPYFHPAFGRFAKARKDLAQQGERTIFNLLGPLLNPAKVKRAMIGLFRPDFVETVAEVMRQTGSVRGLVVSGNGLDELSLCAQNTMMELNKGALISKKESAADFGLPTCDLQDLKGGTPEENATITKSILDGTETGPKKDIVVLNAAAAIYVAQDGISMTEAVEQAKESIESGKALAVLKGMQA